MPLYRIICSTGVGPQSPRSGPASLVGPQQWVNSTGTDLISGSVAQEWAHRSGPAAGAGPQQWVISTGVDLLNWSAALEWVMGSTGRKYSRTA